MTSLSRGDVTKPFTSPSGMPPTSSPTVTLLQIKRREMPAHGAEWANRDRLVESAACVTSTPIDDLFAAVQGHDGCRQRGRRYQRNSREVPAVPDIHWPPPPSDDETEVTRPEMSNSDVIDVNIRPTVTERRETAHLLPPTSQLHHSRSTNQHPTSHQLPTGTVTDRSNEKAGSNNTNDVGAHKNEWHSHQCQQPLQPQPQQPNRNQLTIANASYRLTRYENNPMKIEDYEPGVSSLALHEPTASRYYNPPVEKPGDHCKYIDRSAEMQYRIHKKEASPSPVQSDSSLHEQYRRVQHGGDIPVSGLRCPTPPSTLKYVNGSKARQHVRLVGEDNGDVVNRLLDVELRMLDDVDRQRLSAGSTVSASSSTTPTSGVTSGMTSGMIHCIGQGHGHERQARNEHMNVARKVELEFILAEERRKRLERDVKLNAARRHSACFLLPSRCAPVALDRYSGDEFDHMSSSIPRRSPTYVTNNGGVVRAKAQALYSFQAQSNRELSLRKGDLVYLNRALDDNWFEGERHGLVGIFPTSYVEVIVSIDEANAATTQHQSGLVRIAYDFKSQSPLELSLRKGDLVTVLRQLDKNWYEGRIGNQQGLFPVCYVEGAASKSSLVTMANSLCYSTWSVNSERVQQRQPSDGHLELPDESHLLLAVPSATNRAASAKVKANTVQPSMELTSIPRIITHLANSPHRTAIRGCSNHLAEREQDCGRPLERSYGSLNRRLRRFKEIEIKNGFGAMSQSSTFGDGAFSVGDLHYCDFRRRRSVGNDPNDRKWRRQNDVINGRQTLSRHENMTSSRRDYGDDNFTNECTSTQIEEMTPNDVSASRISNGNNYVDQISDDVIVTSSKKQCGEVEELGVITYTPYNVIQPYSPCDEDELSLAVSDVVYVTESFDDGWLVGISHRTNEYGSFPSTCIASKRYSRLLHTHPLQHQQQTQKPVLHRQQISLPAEL